MAERAVSTAPVRHRGSYQPPRVIKVPLGAAVVIGASYVAVVAAAVLAITGVAR